MRTPLEVVNENSTATKGKATTPSTDPSLREWRVLWKRQLQTSTFYLDRIDETGFALIRAHLALLGVRFTQFFDKNVTHVVTRRAPDAHYNESDVLTRAKKLGSIKVWSLEKLERFLTSLLGHSPRKKLDRADHTKLGQLLQREKLAGGPADKEQYLRFSDNYILVYDPTQCHKPIAHKEWKSAWPQIYPDNAEGMCPFVPCKRPVKRAVEVVELEEEEAPKRQQKDKENEVPVPATRQATMRTKQYGEIVASGMQRNSITSAIISNAPADIVPASRELATLQRKVLAPPRPKKTVKKPRKPGFCENCYERYDNIDEHVLTARHQRYAKDERNFEALDRIIRTYQRPSEAVYDGSSQSTSGGDEREEHGERARMCV